MRFQLKAFLPLMTVLLIGGFTQTAHAALSCNAPKLPAGRNVSVSGPQAFMKAVQSAKGGDVIKLAPGKYGRQNLSNRKFPLNVTVQSANPNQPAEFVTITLENAANITLNNLKFQNDGKVPHSMTKPEPAVFIRNARNINVMNSSFRGFIEPKGTRHAVNDGARGTSKIIDFSGLGRGGGVWAISSDNVRIQGNNFSKLTQIGNFNYDKNLVIAGNVFSGAVVDVTDFGGVDNLLYEGNLIKDTEVPAGMKHADLLQFRFSSSNNVVIRNNIMISDQVSTHGIYLGGGLAGNYRYKDVLIENNKIYGLSRLALAVMRTDGLTIRNNTVYCSKTGSSPAAILVEESSTNVKVTNNNSNTLLATGINWTSKPRPSKWGWTGNDTGTKCVPAPKVTQAPGCGK